MKGHRLIVGMALMLAVLAMTAVGATSIPNKKPKALQPGATIAMVSPASHSDGIDAEPTKKQLQQWGYRVVDLPPRHHGYFAGTDEERARELNQCFADDTIDAVLCANGGYGAARILDLLDYDMIAAHPKLFIGFSDITALHVALQQKSHIVTIYGPMENTLNSEASSAFTLAQFQRGATTKEPLGEVALPAGKRLKAIVPGKAEGLLVGGNLSVIAAAVGTPYELDGTDCILVLEDVGEESYRIDRMMQQLWQSGLLKRVSAIAYGEFRHCSHDPGDFTTEEVLQYYARLAGKPTITGVPSGHGEDNLFLPLGVKATLVGEMDGTARLIINEKHTK